MEILISVIIFCAASAALISYRNWVQLGSIQDALWRIEQTLERVEKGKRL